MNSFITLCGVLIILYCTISWILPKLLAWLFERKYNITLRIGRIGIPYFRLCDVHILKNGISVHVDEIGFRSSFLNSEVTKLVTLFVKDVRINKDIGNNKCDKLEETNIRSDQHLLDFRNKKIPPFITTFAQFMAVHVYNISAMLLRAESPGCLVHVTASELHLDGSVVQNARTLLVNINLSETKVKVLRHVQNKNDVGDTCLGELSFAISMEATLIAQGPLSVEKLHISMAQTCAIINEGFYSFVQERKSKHKVAQVNNTPNIYHRIAPIIPKNFTFKIEETSLRSLKNNSRTDFISTIQTFVVNVRFNARITYNIYGVENLPQVYFALQLHNFSIRSNKEEFLILRKLSLDAKLENNVLNVYMHLDTLSICYNHTMIHHWVHSNFLQNQILKSFNVEQEVTKQNEVGLLEKLANQCIVNGLVDLYYVSVLLRLSDDEETNSSVGFDHTKLLLEQTFETRNSIFSSRLPRILLADRHWMAELLIESLWWHLSSHEPDTTILKKQHPWGTPLFLGVALLKIGSHGNQDTKIDSMLDSLQCEWSPSLAKFLLQALKCLHEYKIPSTKKEKVTKIVSKNDATALMNMSLSNFNCFFITENNVYIVMRLNSITLERYAHKTIIAANGFKMSPLEPNKSYYTCIGAEEIKTYCSYIHQARLDWNKQNETNLQFLEEVIFNWSANLHLKILTLLDEMKDFKNHMNMLLNITDAPRDTSSTKRNINVQFMGNIAIFIRISKNHHLRISLNNMVILSKEEDFNINNTRTVIAIDDADTFTIEGLKVNRIHDDQEIREERHNSDGFILPWNQTWGVTVHMLKASFPYQHDYAETVQNELLSVFKWLKIVHKKTKKPFVANSPLPSDLLINIDEFIFEMSDDPFEVQLRDNYELLEDEYKESLKRQKMLDAKVAELCKTHLHLPAGKVDELYASLNKKNAEIYVQRSKQMYRAVPPRTRLFAWCMNDIKVMALADPSIHGTENVIKMMREIDPDSPWPEEDLEFTTLWCRSVIMSCKEWKYLLRDFPQPLLDISQLQLWGRLVAAEQEAPRRAKRGVTIELGEPWGSITIERGMTPLKFYHDFNCEVQHYSYAFGPCWEPVIAQCNLSFEKISAPSRYPSPPLPFWDKMRLLFHGRLTMCIAQLTVLLHASLDPYNTTEEMELTWSDVAMDWTNAKFVYKGDLNVYVRTASKYDDCQLLHLPNLKLTIKIDWVCLADPNDHHSVIPCAPDKLPEYSSNQEHDSFRAFRSQDINITIALETKSITNQSPNEFDYPVLVLYGSTLRWIENLKLILSGVTRPTRRGTIFKNVRPRKIQLSRHYRKVHLSLGLHRFQICYWMSFAKQRGFELLGGRLSSSSEHTLALVPIDDGLKHRPRAEWSIMYMNCDLTDAEIWLQSALQEENSEKEVTSMRQPVEKCYCLSVGKVSYGRETVLFTRGEHASTDRTVQGSKDTPTHRLVVYDLKGAWTKSNRNVAFALFDTFMKTKQLKKNLSTEALKGFRCETNSTPLKTRRNAEPSTTPPNPAGIQVAQTTTSVQGTPSPISKIQSGHAATMLQQLIAEAENKNVVFSDDLSCATRQQHLKGLQACQEDDVQHKNWLIALVNSQVLLKGCETKGYVILSAAKAEILQRVHRPVWKDHTLVSKTTWVGSLECLQYYATVSAGENDTLDDNIMWLTVDNIQEKDSTVIADLPDVPDLVGSGQSVGGVVSETVGASNIGENPPVQLQRIVSRCKCEFFYVGYGDSSIDPNTVGEVPPPPQEDVGPWDRQETAVDAFTLMHHDLDVCTNSLQYAMLLDIVNNLLLYVEPHRKKALERLARMRFQLQLNSIEDQKRPIQNIQNQVRGLVSKIRRLEKEWYLVHKALAEDQSNYELIQEINTLEKLVYECKELLTNQSEELDIMLSCYKEKQLLATSRLATTRNDKPVTTVKANEICFKHAQWRLTEADGQLGIADLVLSNFLYTKNSRSDDSVEHLLELGYIRMTNLLPNQIYTEVLCPTEIQSTMPIDHKRVLRVFCRERPPVGGISVKEHFEINVVPITIGLTKKFFNTMLRFCFPERDPDNIDGEAGEEIEETSRGKRTRSSMKKHSKDTNFYVRIDPKDDVEKMKERAEKNKLFIYIKIPEVPVRVSYKGNKEKNIEDIRDFSLVIPTLEYHNVTWTWLDLLLAMKSDSRKVILSQAIKQKLQINRNRGSADESAQPQEEDKARMLFGARHVPGDKSLKKGVSGVFKFHKCN